MLPLSPLPTPWEDMLWTLGKVATALLFVVLGYCLLLSIAACSTYLKRVLTKLTVVLAEIPAFCLLGFFCAIFPSFWSVAGVACYSLLARTVHESLKAGNEIPSSYLKTARALRLDRWQSFWRLHMPFAFPDLVRTVLRGLPGFWLQILGGELAVSLFLPHTSPGLGKMFLQAVQRKEQLVAFGILALMMMLIFLVQHGFIRPLRGYGRHYAVCDLAKAEIDKYNDRPSFCRTHYVAGATGTLLASILLSCGFWGFPGPFIALLVAILMNGIFWGVVGGLLLGLSMDIRKKFRKCCLIAALIPVFLFYMVFPVSYLAFIVPALAIVSISGWAFFLYDSNASGRQFVMMGRYLRLPLLSRWKDIRFPLLSPALLQAAIMALPFFWDNVYMIALLKQGTYHLTILQAHTYGMQGILLILMTLLAISVRWGVFIPLQERMSHRYRI
ncbi:ABC transporter permease subunit [Bombella sp. TMW 2.2559]|uniref:ABC transporter permease subunit n=1 Tax=Bombella dulcis TaxID=2967339 RepID=A0ABT3WFV1_9PROT|nr:ABC transporter permease subunit [Bombella dulcis]MCX5615761.1 ABC transporter permease subunit [Bombella dulcis]